MNPVPEYEPSDHRILIITTDPYQCVYPHDMAHTIFHRDGGRFKAIFGSDVPSDFPVCSPLNAETAYIFYLTGSKRYQPLHVSYKPETLRGFEYLERHFPKETY